MAGTTGIYIGTDNIDIVSLTGSFQRPQLVGFARAKLPNQSAWRGQVRVEGQTAPEAPSPPAEQAEAPVIACIQNLFGRLGLPPNPQAMAGLPSESVVIRYFQMPAIPPHERKMAIAFEAKKYLPFKLEELISDFQVVVRRSDPTLMRIMFFGIKRNSSLMYAGLFKSSGISAVGLEPAPLSLMRLLRSNGQMGQGEVAAILLIEQDTATINITRNDLLYLSRNVTISGPASPAEGPIGELIDALVNETRVSIDYYRRRFLGEPAVSKVIVFGKTLEPPRMEELSKALDLPVQMGDTFGRISGAKSVPEGLAVAAGLALRGLEKKQGGVNLLAPEHRPKEQNLLRPLIAEAVASAAILAVWYGVSVADLQSWNQQLSGIRSQQIAPGQAPPGAAPEELRQILSSGRKELRTLQAFTRDRVRPSVLLADLSRLMPEEAWLRYTLFRDMPKEPDSGTVSTERRRLLRVSGNAFAGDRSREFEKVNQFLSAIQQDPLFSSTFSEFSLDSVQRGSFSEEEVTEFRLTFASDPEEIRLEEERDRPARRRSASQ